MTSENTLLQHEMLWPIPDGSTIEETVLAHSSARSLRQLAENDSDGLGRRISKTANRLSRSRRIALIIAGSALGTVLGAGLYFDAHVGTLPEHPNATQQIEIPHSKTKQIVNALGLFGVFGLAIGWSSGELLKSRFARGRASAHYDRHMQTAAQWSVPTVSGADNYITVESESLHHNRDAFILPELDLPDVVIPSPNKISPTDIPPVHIPDLGTAFKMMIVNLGELK